MTEHKKYKVSDELIVKFLYGNISREEADYILDAIDNREERRHLIEIKNMIDEAHTDDIINATDVDASLERLYQKISDGSKISQLAPVTKKTDSRNFIFKVAATVVLLLGLGLFWFYNNQSEEVVLASNQESITNVVLPDSSVIDINKNTQLIYPDKFTGRKREVKLISGEAYFAVKQNKNKTFTVKTDFIDVQVLGTEFNVTLDKEKGETKVIVQEGTVRVMFKLKGNKQLEPIILKAGNKCIFTQSTYTIDTITKPNQNELAWKTGVFVFNNTPLSEALEVVAEEFEHELFIEAGAVKNCSISAVINNTKLTSILKGLEISMNIEARIDKSTVYISGKGCEEQLE